jgi:hypothetical protein
MTVWFNQKAGDYSDHYGFAPNIKFRIQKSVVLPSVEEMHHLCHNIMSLVIENQDFEMTRFLAERGVQYCFDSIIKPCITVEMMGLLLEYDAFSGSTCATDNDDDHVPVIELLLAFGHNYFLNYVCCIIRRQDRNALLCMISNGGCSMLTMEQVVLLIQEIVKYRANIHDTPVKAKAALGMLQLVLLNRKFCEWESFSKWVYCKARSALDFDREVKRMVKNLFTIEYCGDSWFQLRRKN